MEGLDDLLIGERAPGGKTDLKIPNPFPVGETDASGDICGGEGDDAHHRGEVGRPHQFGESGDHFGEEQISDRVPFSRGAESIDPGEPPVGEPLDQVLKAGTIQMTGGIKWNTGSSQQVAWIASGFLFH